MVLQSPEIERIPHLNLRIFGFLKVSLTSKELLLDKFDHPSPISLKEFPPPPPFFKRSNPGRPKLRSSEAPKLRSSEAPQAAREAFRRWRGGNEEAWDWTAAQVPEGITDESEQKRREKEKAGGEGVGGGERGDYDPLGF